MEALLATIAPHWTRQPGATAAAIRTAEALLGRPLPEEYAALLAWSNGGDGWIGEHYFILWPVEELATINEEYELTTALGPIVGIGSNGGGECYAFDYHDFPATVPLVLLPIIGGDDPETWLTIGSSLEDGLRRLLADPDWPFNR